MANVPQAPLEGSGSTSSDQKAILFMTEDDGVSGLQAALFQSVSSETVNGQRLGVLSTGVADGNDAAVGATTDVAVITDTTGSLSGKIRGLVKWAFERMPASLGQKAMAASLPVVVASDQSTLEVVGDAAEDAAVSGNPILSGGRYDAVARALDDGDVGALAVDPTGKALVAPHITESGSTYTTNTGITVGSTSTLVIDANADRVGLVLTNDSNQVIYLSLGGAAVMNDGIRLNANGGSYEINWTNLFRLAVYAISASGSANICVTEIEVY